MEKEYNSSSLLYQFDIETEEEIMRVLADQLRERRLEKSLSRGALAMMIATKRFDTL